MEKTTKKLLSILFIAVLNLAVNNFSFSQNVNVTPNAASYSTLRAAFTAINAGTHGNGAVTVSITGNTTETAGAFLNGGVFTSCSITPVGARTCSGNFAEAIIVLDGADNVTINGLNTGGNSLTLTNTNTGLAQGCLRLSNGASNNTMRNLTCNGVGQGSTIGGRTIYIGQSTTGTGGNNDNTIENCTVNGGRRGIQIFGTDGNGTFGYYNDRTIIRGNIVKNCSSLYIFIGTATRDNLCELNQVFSDAAVTNDAAGSRGINVQGLGSNIVRKNKVYSLTGIVAGGFIGIITIPNIVLAPLTAPAQTTVEVTNNFVALNNCIAAAPFVRGIWTNSNTTTVNYTSNVYFNSIRIGGSSGATAGALTVGLEEGLDGLHGLDTARIYNNIAINDRLAGDANSRHVGSDLNPATGVNLSSDYNTVFASDTSGRGWAAGYKGTLYNGPAGNQLYWDSTFAADIELSTVFDNVHFLSDTDLHLAGKIGGNMDAKDVTGFTTDIDGDSRVITSTNLFTYRGADEHLPTGGAAWRKGTRIILFSLQGTDFPDRAVGDPIPGVDVSLEQVPGDAHDYLFHPNTETIVNNVISMKINFGDSVTASNYYIYLKFTNAIRTVTGLPVNLTATTGTYDFTTSLSQAYGNNMYGTSPPFQIYGGDVNQDDVIDASDVSAVDNDGYNFVSGLRIRTDVNYDGFVDASDASIVDNNAYNFVSAVIPPGYENAQFIQNTNPGNAKSSMMRKQTNILTRQNVGLSN